MTKPLVSGTQAYDDYVAQGYARHLENQRLWLVKTKKQYADLNITWSPEIEHEAKRLAGAGITKYLRKVSKEQNEARLASLPTWGIYG